MVSWIDNYASHARIRAWRRLCFAVIVGIALFATVPCLAAGEEAVRVAVIDYPNYIQMNNDGSVSGYVYEYLTDIQKYTGWEYDFIEMSFAQASSALEAGEIDLLAGSQYTPGRAALYDFSERDMGEGGSVLCVMPEATEYCYNDYASYDGMRIAALTGSVRIEQTREKLRKYGADAQFVSFDTDAESKAALESGAVDAVLMSIIRCENKYKILARISSAPLYFCVNKRRPELKAQLDEAMEALHLESPYYEEQLNKKYYGSIPVQLSFTSEEKAYIAASKPIAVAIFDDLVPIEYYNAEAGRYSGIVPDSFQIIEAYSGLTFRFVAMQDVDTLREQMRSGDVQLLASVANIVDLAEQLNVSLTDSYYENSVSMLINDSAGNYQSSDCSVVLRTGYLYLEQLARELGYTNIQYADTFSGCTDMVNAQKADLTLLPSACVDSIVHTHDYHSVSNYLVPDTYMDFSIGVGSNESPLLLSILNKSISSITKEQRTNLLIQNLSAVNGSLSLRNFFAAHRLSIMIIALGFAAIIVTISVAFAVTRQQLNRKLRLALEKADAASRAKTEFLARMSHDMRTPMNGILGLSYLMEEHAATSEMKSEVFQLRESGEYLLQLINDVLDVNKAELGQIELHPKVCDEELLFSSIIELLTPQIEKKRIIFSFEKKNIQWTYMLLDEQRVKQIFVNLLSNAIKFTPTGGHIDFVMELVSGDERMVRDKFIIRDTGIGMSEEFLPALFEPFSQENRKEQETGGTGLGLAIVKELVDLMGGSISVKSFPNKGTEFTLYLDFPLAPRPAETESLAHAPDLGFPSGIRVLLCEDHPLNAQIAERMLKRRGAEVVWKENGQVGVEAFANSGPDYFDAILMDVRMPVMDGLEAAKHIRALNRPDAKTVPIIAMTANAYEEDIKKSLAAGMDEHLAKPVAPDILYKTIARLIDARRHGISASGEDVGKGE